MFQIGDLVRVCVPEPSLGWGPIDPTDIGEVIGVPGVGGLQIYRIKFEGKHNNWGGYAKDLELVDPDLAKIRNQVRFQPII